MARVLASHQCGLGSIRAWCHMLVEFVVGSRLAPRVFLSGFPPFTVTNISKFQFDQDRGLARKAGKPDVAPSLNIIII